MFLIGRLTDNSFQQFTLDSIPGVSVSVLLRFMPRVQTWNMDITWNDFTLNGVPLVCGPNILRQWRNIIPFGIGISNIYFLDPYALNDFSTGNSSFYFLTSDDVTAIEAEFFS